MTISCPHCGQKSELKNAKRLSGKKVFLKCSNNRCNEKFEYDFRIKSDEDTTFLTPSLICSGASQLRIMKEDKSVIKIMNLEPKDYIIGRERGKGFSTERIVIEDPYISRKHCFIKCSIDLKNGKKRYLVHDLNSTNKTLLNDKELSPDEEVYLSNGDIIKVGNSFILYRELTTNKVYENI
ncbi:MAG: FHA domain-containing protein [Chitinophagaceae bacterium]|nr:MAG: FHA domain-containing protein [Chitinophagaceae bacterium]